MLKEGEVVTAKVVHIEHYGAYLHYADTSILVLGPDASATGDVPVKRAFKVNDLVRIRVGRYNATDNVYRGFVS